MPEVQGLDVLAIAAHPDDVEISIGGTLIKLSQQGYRTGILDLTRGEAGTRGTPAVRAGEASRAAKALGCSVRENLGLPDAHIANDESARNQLVRTIRRLRPRVIFTQHWEDPHPDHTQTSLLVRQAAHLSGLAKYDADAGLERFRPNSIAYFLFPRTTIPSFVVDISAQNSTKWEAIRCHASQFYDPLSSEPQSRVSTSQFLDEIEARDRYFGAIVGVERGEAFLVREALNVEDPVLLLTAKMNMYS